MNQPSIMIMLYKVTHLNLHSIQPSRSQSTTSKRWSRTHSCNPSDSIWAGVHISFIHIYSKVVNFSKKYDSIFNKMFSSDYRYYFDVDNKYVARKIVILMAPFTKRVDHMCMNI